LVFKLNFTQWLNSKSNVFIRRSICSRCAFIYFFFLQLLCTFILSLNGNSFSFDLSCDRFVCDSIARWICSAVALSSKILSFVWYTIWSACCPLNVRFAHSLFLVIRYNSRSYLY
jgi:hypothetical protein